MIQCDAGGYWTGKYSQSMPATLPLVQTLVRNSTLTTSRMMGVRQHLSHVIPGDPDERVCPACGRGFKTSQGMLSHLKQARTCRWYKNGKNRDLSGYSMPQIIRTAAQTNVAHQGSMQDVDTPDFDDIMEQHNLFELVPPAHDYDQHGASSSSSSSAGPSNLNLLAGRVVRMSEAVVEKWKAYFWEEPAEDEEDTTLPLVQTLVRNSTLTTSRMMGVRQHLSHVIPSDPDERVCPACGRGFKTSQGMLSHLKQARTCRWYKNGKNRDLSGYSMPQIIRTAAQTNVAHQGSMQDVDTPDFDDIMEQHNLFELVPPAHDYDQHGASSSSSSSAGPSNLNLVQ
ncbi:hypothetical protein FOMPIDRAFT_1016984 [Fomitopsis schrenkii]|uniref:C2H2-type domain-containing protein n=1 Tax=Fomitopsis schrenkii TaxID=2126942 RepID=S8E8R6_FOMSC|nr:hypothetical protein FOMPIDRAFT_1016984 [Fomitopsis schrenkii]